MKTTGERIKELRKSLGISQQELAEQLGYKDKSSIARIETDSYKLPQCKIKKLADILETAPSYLMGWDDETEPCYFESEIIQLAQKIQTDPNLRMLYESSRKLSQAELRAVRIMIDTFVSRRDNDKPC